MAAIIIAGYMMVLQGRKGLYLGLILVWALPFALLLWYVSSKIGVFNSYLMNHRNLAYQFIIQLPLTGTLLPIALPTLYLWIVDTLAMRRGTWVIESGTKLEWNLWDGLDIEYDSSTLFPQSWTDIIVERQSSSLSLMFLLCSVSLHLIMHWRSCMPSHPFSPLCHPFPRPFF